MSSTPTGSSLGFVSTPRWVFNSLFAGFSGAGRRILNRPSLGFQVLSVGVESQGLQDLQDVNLRSCPHYKGSPR